MGTEAVPMPVQAVPESCTCLLAWTAFGDMIFQHLVGMKDVTVHGDG